VDVIDILTIVKRYSHGTELRPATLWMTLFTRKPNKAQRNRFKSRLHVRGSRRNPPEKTCNQEKQDAIKSNLVGHVVIRLIRGMNRMGSSTAKITASPITLVAAYVCLCGLAKHSALLLPLHVSLN